MYDVIVVGLGPAGSMAALDLAKKGVKVLAIDKATFPRYKSCGGCISVKVDSIVDFDFSHLVEDTVKGITFTFKSQRELVVDSERVIAYNVSRNHFDAFLVDKARSAGAVVMEGRRVTGCTQDETGIDVRTEHGSYRAKFLIGTDGANGMIGRDILNMDYENSHLSLTAEITAPMDVIDRLRGRCLVDFGSIPYGYAWIFPKAKTLSIGIAGYSSKVKKNIKGYFKAFTQDHPMLSGLNTGDIKGWLIPVYHGRDQKLFSGRTLVAGDAAHLVDPFLGEGIHYAMRSGQIAAQAASVALDKGVESLSSYRDRIDEEFYDEFEANGALVNLIYKYPRIWYRIVEMEPCIMEKYYNVLRGEVTCAEFYSDLKGRLVKKSWRILSKLLRPSAKQSRIYE